MSWNQYLPEAFAWDLLVLPGALVAAKIAFPRTRWLVVWLVAAGLSWIVSVSYFSAFPADNGFGAVIARLFGWMTMLPVVALFSLSWFIRPLHGTRAAKIVMITPFVIAVLLPVIACFRWIPEREAKIVAMEELKARGFVDFHISDAKRTWAGWTISARLATKESYPVTLSRSGFCTGTGG